MNVSDELMERDEEIAKYKHVVMNLKESEQFIDKVMKEKESREDELLNKMSTLAEHYHKEKDRCQKLTSEIQRQNDTLKRLETLQQ
jgi:chromatin segregation and condensation protein Rec8/ScpA/Scc1 (kleisin family)